MATVQEAIEDLAQLTHNIKTKYRLSENTVLRLIDIQLAMTTYAPPAPPQIADETPEPTTDEEAA